MIRFLDDGDLVEQDRDWINRILGFSGDGSVHHKGSSFVQFPFEDVPRFLPSAAEDAACSPTGLDSQTQPSVEPRSRERSGGPENCLPPGGQTPSFLQPPPMPPPSVPPPSVPQFPQTNGPPPPIHSRRVSGNRGNGLFKTPPGPPRVPLHIQSPQQQYQYSNFLVNQMSNPYHAPGHIPQSHVFSNHVYSPPAPVHPSQLGPQSFLLSAPPPGPVQVVYTSVPPRAYFGQVPAPPSIPPQRPPPRRFPSFSRPPAHHFSAPGPSPPRHRPRPPSQSYQPHHSPSQPQIQAPALPEPARPIPSVDQPVQEAVQPEKTEPQPIIDEANVQDQSEPTAPEDVPEDGPGRNAKDDFPKLEEQSDSGKVDEATEDIPLETETAPVTQSEAVTDPVEVKTAVEPEQETEKVEVTEEADSESQPARQPPQPKTWASLFSGTKQTGTIVYSSSDSTVMLADKSSVIKKTVPNSQDPSFRELCESLRSAKLIHRGQGYNLRGLRNMGNDCYANSVLQALLACPPFFNLLKDLTPFASRQPTSTPLLDAIVSFVSEFAQISARDRRYAGPFSPDSVHEAVKALNPSDATFKQGLQEDAEEFLLTILNGLHEEILSCTKKESVEIEDNSNDEWQEVGPGKKSAVTRRVGTEETVISELFSGKHRNTVRKGGAKETVNLEPFFTLPLEIQKDEIIDINSAIISSLGQETIKQMTSDSREVETKKLVKLQDLPPVMIIQLKRFVYTAEGTRKVMKKIKFDVDLQIPKETVYSGPHWQSSRSYKLFAVVFHHGKEAQGGHYTANVFHAMSWVELDDAKVRKVDVSEVLQDSSETRVPYLLFYRRCDLLHRSASYQTQSYTS